MRAMMIGSMMALAACGATGATGQSPASRSYAISGFTGVALTGADDVDVRVGPTFSIRAQGPAAVVDRLLIERKGNTLRVGRVRGTTVTRGTARIVVTMPRIDAATLAGSGDLSVDRVEGGALDASLSGSGNIRVAAMRVERATLSVAGSGDIAAAGSAARLDASVAGSGDITAPGLVARQATVAVMGSGNVTARVDGTATVSIMGSGDVDLGARARCTVARRGSGSARCGG